MTFCKAASAAVTLSLLTGCAGKDASHVPPLVTLPYHAVTAGISNAAYAQRRARVRAHVATNQDALWSEILSGDGPALETAYRLARIPKAKKVALLTAARKRPDLYAKDPEALTIALMVHGD